MIYKMTLKDSVDTTTFNLLETPIVDKDIEGAVDNVTLDGNQYTDYLYLKKQYIQKWAIMCPDGYDELRGFYTRQFENGEVPSYRVYYGANVTRDYTLNGDYLQFNAEGIETAMTLSQLLGNAEQTTYSGKNLLNTNALSRTLPYQATSRGITFTLNADGSITVNGKNDGTGNSTFTLYNSTTPLVIVGGTYTGDLNPSDGVYRAVSMVVYDGAHYRGFTQNSTQSLDASNALSYLQVTSGESTQFSNYKIYPMLENGSSKSPYEPYVGSVDGSLTPSPSPSYPQAIETVTRAQNIKVVGKNLLDDTTAQRTIPSSGTFNVTIPMTIGAGIYSFGAFANGSLCSESNYYVFQFRNGSTPIVQSSTPPGPMTLTAEEASQVDNMFLYFNSSFTGAYGGKHLTAMVCSGSTLGAYEPYQGQSYEVNLGKNLLGGYTYDYGASGATATYHEDGTLTMTGTATATTWSTGTNFAFTRGLGVTLPAGTYTFTTVGGHEAQLVSVLTDGTGEVANAVISTGDGSATFTTTAERFFYARLRVLAGATDYTCKFMLEESASATAYAPYFTPIELAKVGDYQDRIYKNGGKWYIEKNVGKAVFDSTNVSSIMQNASNPNRYLNPSGSTIFTGLALSLPSFQSYCSHYTFVRNGTAWQGIGKCGFDPTGTFWLMDSNTNLTTLRAWLASEEVYIYYPLATPTTTEITDDTLLLQLNFLASLYEGVNNISLTGTGAQGEMEVFIRDVMSVETDVVPEVPVRLTLTDDGAINACGCRRNVQLTMRETTE